jgi:hypothetical protein
MGYVILAQGIEPGQVNVVHELRARNFTRLRNPDPPN